LAKDPQEIVSALVEVLGRLGRDEYENTLVPPVSCESKEALTRFLTQAAQDIASVSETCLTTCLTLRAGALSRPLQNYAGDSGASMGNSPNSFVSSVPGVQRTMELIILHALDALAGGVQEGGAGRLWRVLLRVNPLTMCNPDPDGKPDEARSRPKRSGGSATPGSGGKKPKDVERADADAEKADADTAAAIVTAAQQVAKSMPTDREIKIERLARAIARMQNLPDLTAEEDQKLSQLQEYFRQENEADVDDLLGI
jgi:hypothetical protein